MKEIKREFAGRLRRVGYELTEKGKIQAQKDFKKIEEIEKRISTAETYLADIGNFIKEERILAKIPKIYDGKRV